MTQLIKPIKKRLFKILNIGGEFNIKLTALVKLIEKKIKKKSKNSIQTKNIIRSSK